MTPEALPEIIWLIAKLFVLLGLGVYVIIALVIVRQEQLMEHVLEEAFEPILRILVLLHLVSAIGVFILALILL